MPPDRRPIHVFVSYAHRDAAFFSVFNEGLKAHLNTAQKFNFQIWDDSKIHVGSFWDNEIQENLDSDLAILCISANFLNSNYIGEKELGNLVKKFPRTLLVPVYFNHCQFIKWAELSETQFFKPGGEAYGKPGNADFAFCDLVKFNETDGEFIPNANIDRYFVNMLQKIEDALINRYSGSTIKPSFTGPVETGKEVPARISFPAKVKSIFLEGGMDLIVNILIILAMLFSAWRVFGFLISKEEGSQFRILVSCAMFFGSLAAFIFSKKIFRTKRVAV